jgi:glycosyltransferase involved in cell wall biosynthesis
MVRSHLATDPPGAGLSLVNLRVGLDATALLGPRTGIGTYVANLLDQLHHLVLPPGRVVATAFTLRGAGRLHEELPPGVQVRTTLMPARLLRAAWLRGAWPPVETLTGSVDVFHGTNFVAPPTRRAGTVVTIHDLAFLRHPDTVAAASLAYRELVPRALRQGAVVVTPTRAVADQILDAYPVAPERVHPTPLGIEPSWFTVAQARTAHRTPVLAGLGTLPDEYLVAVGTLEPRKNLGFLLAVLRLAHSRGLHLPPLLIVGGHGWGASLDLTGLVPAHVWLTGHLPYSVLQTVVARARLLLFPSLDEGFGLPPLEALAAGTPVVAADIPVCREVLGAQAAYASPHDAEHFLDVLLTSLDTPVGSVSSRQTHARAFTWLRCAQATIAAYQLAG